MESYDEPDPTPRDLFADSLAAQVALERARRELEQAETELDAATLEAAPSDSELEAIIDLWRSAGLGTAAPGGALRITAPQGTVAIVRPDGRLGRLVSPAMIRKAGIRVLRRWALNGASGILLALVGVAALVGIDAAVGPLLATFFALVSLLLVFLHVAKGRAARKGEEKCYAEAPVLDRRDGAEAARWITAAAMIMLQEVEAQTHRWAESAETVSERAAAVRDLASWPEMLDRASRARDARATGQD